MRLALLVLNIAIGLSLAVHVLEADAAASSKIVKKKALSGKKSSKGTADVWERIRAGMKISGHALSAANDAEDRSSSPAIAMKMRKGPDGMADISKSSPGAAVETAPRYTELGRSKLGRQNYTELGWKLLGAKAATIAENDCTSAVSGKSRQEIPYAAQYRPSLIKLKNQEKILDAHPELQLRLHGDGAKKSAARLDADKGLPPLSKAMHSGPSLKGAASGTTCSPSQLASSQPKLKRNSPASQTGHADSHAALNDRIGKYIAAYTQDPDFLYRVARRAHPYLYHIVEELHKYHLPLELALLPIVESAYQPTAESSKSAKGLWQFIPSTGRDYDLVQSHDYDERLDIPKSTQAAIRFLSGLNQHFKGDWLLALAAYNSGQATVDNAISQNQASGLSTDFWSLKLPEETQNYVPRLLALSKIFAHPASYGIKLPAIKNEPYFVKVKIDNEFDVNYLADKEISTIARLANLDRDLFGRLNPGYLGSSLTRKRSYSFLMPLNNANQLRQHLASIAQFMSEPESPAKSVIRKDQRNTLPGLYDPSLSLVSELVFRKSPGLPKIAAPFLSLNIESDPSAAEPLA